MSEELYQTYRRIARAVCAEDLFGDELHDTRVSREERLRAIKRTYRELALIVHPDRHDEPETREAAEDAFMMLQRFYESAQRKVELNLGAWGSNGYYTESETSADSPHTTEPTPDTAQRPADAPVRVPDDLFTITTELRTYHLHEQIAEGDVAEVYGGVCSDDADAGHVVAKIAYEREDNDLMRVELRALRKLAEHPARQSRHLPVLLDEFRTEDGRLGTILRRCDGLSLEELRERFPHGIPQRHVMWMMRRLLSVVGFAHSLGIMHGNIEPTHIMIRPHDHNVWLIDWTAAIIDPARTHDRFKMYNEHFSAPEVAERKPPIPPADLYSIGRCMIYALGLDLDAPLDPGALPDHIDAPFARLLRFFTRDSPLQRAQDAWAMYRELDRIREQIYGPHTFVPFDVPDR